MTLNLKGKRKWTACLAAMISATFAVGFGWINGSEYQLVVLGTVGAFIAGNYGEHKAK